MFLNKYRKTHRERYYLLPSLYGRGLGVGLLLFCLLSCSKPQPTVTPWGETIGEDGAPVEQVDTAGAVSLSDIVDAGEMIMLTVSGPETYYDYHGHGMGLQYLLCEKFAQKLGVGLRVEVCKDSAEVMIVIVGLRT